MYPTPLRGRTVALAALFLLMARAHASSLSFTVAPTSAETCAPPGTTVTGVLRVKYELPAGAPNPEGPIRLRVYPMDWSLDRQGSPQFLKPGTTAGSCSAWLQINPAELVVSAGETRDVRYTVTIPQGVQGTFRTILMVESAPQPTTLNTRTVSVNGRIGSAVYIQVGPQARRARITNFAVLPERSAITVENTGTSHLRLKGVLQFRDALGLLVRQITLPGAVVLPGKEGIREIQMDTPRLPGASAYTATLLLDYGGETLLGARAKLAVP